MVKKLFMALYGPIENDGRVLRAAEALSEVYEVTVLSVSSGRPYTNAKFHSQAIMLPKSKGLTKIGRLYFWLRFWIASLIQRPEVVYAHDFTLAFPGWWASVLCRSLLIYDAHELIIPEENTYSYRKLWCLLECWASRRADVVIAANRERAELMMKYYDLPEVPIVVRNIPPMPESQLSNDEVLAQYPMVRRKRDDQVILVYQGDISLTRGIGDFVDAMSHVDERFSLLFVGGGPDLESLKAKVAQLGLNGRIAFAGVVPREHLHDILRLCDIGIVTYATTGLNNIYCAPNKIYEYAQAGLPVVTTDQPTLKSLLASHPIGLTVLRTDDAPYHLAIAEAVRVITNDLHVYKKESLHFLKDNSWDGERVKLTSAVSGNSNAV